MCSPRAHCSIPNVTFQGRAVCRLVGRNVTERNSGHRGPRTGAAACFRPVGVFQAFHRGQAPPPGNTGAQRRSRGVRGASVCVGSCAASIDAPGSGGVTVTPAGCFIPCNMGPAWWGLWGRIRGHGPTASLPGARASARQDVGQGTPRVYLSRGFRFARPGAIVGVVPRVIRHNPW